MNGFRRPASDEMTVIAETLSLLQRKEKLFGFLTWLLVPGSGLLLIRVIKWLPLCLLSGMLLMYTAAWALTSGVDVGAGNISPDELLVMDGKASRQSIDAYPDGFPELDSYVEFVSHDGDAFNQLFPAGNKIAIGTPLLLVYAPTGKGDYDDCLMFVVPSPDD